MRHIYIIVVTLRINLACARHNLRLIKERVKTPVYAVVKADAYGHGAELCRFIENDVFGFAVSCATEAEELRRLKIKKPILILCPSNPIDCDDIIYTACEVADLPKKKGARVAVKINSGMNRLGIIEERLDEMLKAIHDNHLFLSEAYTHFSSLLTAEAQFERFNAMLKDKNLHDIPRHCCASNCMALPEKMFCSAVRCGLALYGYGYSGLMPILSAYTYVGQINEIKKGMLIGYGGITAQKDMRVAVLKAGYADGIRRTDGRRIRINGYTCELVGKICMDMCMADITDAYVEKGDRAYFLDNIINADVLAKEQNTITYEILTMFSAKRIKRIYE